MYASLKVHLNPHHSLTFYDIAYQCNLLLPIDILLI